VSILATLSKASESDVSFLFGYNSSSSSADNLNDFLLQTPNDLSGRPTGTSDTVTFEPGETTKSIRLNVVADDIYEGSEVISFVILNNPQGKLQSTVNLPIDASKRFFFQINVEDDESTPVVNISKVIVANNPVSDLANNINVNEDQSVAITVSLPESKSGFDLKVKFELTPGPNAVEGLDYAFPFSENRLTPTDITSEIIIPATTAALTFYLPIYPDLILEDPETLTLTLLSGDDYIVTTTNTSTITIVINDDGNNGIALNDTGINTCYVDNNTPWVCNDVGEFPQQDGAVIGGNGPRFLKYLYVKEASTGLMSGLAPGADWNCVYDQNTGLLWEIPKNRNETYTWYNSNPTTNGGADGIKIDNSTPGSSNVVSTRSTQDHINELNEKDFTTIDNRLCEIGNWRLPKLNELLSIMSFETPETNLVFLDSTFFPTPSFTELFYYWTSTPSAISTKHAWCVFLGKSTKDSVKVCNKTEDALPAIMVNATKINL